MEHIRQTISVAMYHDTFGQNQTVDDSSLVKVGTQLGAMTYRRCLPPLAAANPSCPNGSGTRFFLKTRMMSYMFCRSRASFSICHRQVEKFSSMMPRNSSEPLYHLYATPVILSLSLASSRTHPLVQRSTLSSGSDESIVAILGLRAMARCTQNRARAGNASYWLAENAQCMHCRGMIWK